jgi:hypothetical protein
MTEIVLLKLLDFGFTAAQIGLERQAVLDAATARVAAGDTPDQLVAFLAKMRDEAIAKAEKAVS